MIESAGCECNMKNAIIHIILSHLHVFYVCTVFIRCTALHPNTTEIIIIIVS